MNIKFSFTDKKELFFIDEKPYIEKIGSLISCIIDTNWTAFNNQLNNFLQTERTEELALSETLKSYLINSDIHPLLEKYFSESSSVRSLTKRISEIDELKSVVASVMEALVDEPQNMYQEYLMDLVSDERNEMNYKYYSALGSARLIPVTEYNMMFYYQVTDFPFIFEADDIETIVFQQIQFMCRSYFYIRKCACCKRIMWTRKTNQVYCKRIVPNTNKTCNQIGPSKQWQYRHSELYKIYWMFRNRIYQKYYFANNSMKFKIWQEKTDVYRDRAKRGAIQEDELYHALSQIEKEIFC